MPLVPGGQRGLLPHEASERGGARLGNARHVGARRSGPDLDDAVPVRAQAEAALGLSVACCFPFFLGDADAEPDGELALVAVALRGGRAEDAEEVDRRRRRVFFGGTAASADADAGLDPLKDPAEPPRLGRELLLVGQPPQRRHDVPHVDLAGPLPGVLLLEVPLTLSSSSSSSPSLVAEDEAPAAGDFFRSLGRGVGGAPGFDGGEGDEGEGAPALLAAGGEVAPELVAEPGPERVGVPALREAQQGRGGRRDRLRRRRSLRFGSGGDVGGVDIADRSVVRVRILRFFCCFWCPSRVSWIFF